MGISIWIIQEKWESLDKGNTWREIKDTVYDANITHNLSKMAFESGIYDAIWGISDSQTICSEVSEMLAKGIQDMKDRPEYYRQFSAGNGWGTYEQFIPWLENLLEAYIKYPNATISISK